MTISDFPTMIVKNVYEAININEMLNTHGFRTT